MRNKILRGTTIHIIAAEIIRAVRIQAPAAGSTRAPTGTPLGCSPLLFGPATAAALDIVDAGVRTGAFQETGGVSLSVTVIHVAEGYFGWRMDEKQKKKQQQQRK